MPRAWAHRFPGRGSHLQRYAQRLNCAEINSSFYRPHARATYERWATAVPPTFKFAVKVPKEITHEARLRRARVPLMRFLDEIKGLGGKLGPLLIQLPPSLAFDAKVTGRFCTILRELYRGPVVIEPRHRSWFTARSERLLVKHRIGRVAADPAVDATASRPGGVCNPAQYYRLHGSPRMYWSNYLPADLRTLAKTVGTAHGAAAVWIIFDNTAAGCAIANALQLQALLTRGRGI